MSLFIVALALVAQAAGGHMPTLVTDQMSNVDQPRQAVARTPAEWAALWRDHAGDAPRPAVDFDKHMVAAVFLGTKTSAGYDVEFVSAAPSHHAFVVEWAETRPGPGQVSAQIITMPARMVLVPRAEGPVRFEKVVR